MLSRAYSKTAETRRVLSGMCRWDREVETDPSGAVLDVLDDTAAGDAEALGYKIKRSAILDWWVLASVDGVARLSNHAGYPVILVADHNSNNRAVTRTTPSALGGAAGKVCRSAEARV